MGIKSPKVSLSSPSRTERAMFDFNQSGPRSPNIPIKSPRSPRKFNYDEDGRETAGSSDCDPFNFSLASPPKKSITDTPLLALALGILLFKEKKKPKCNIRTNPGYDEKYSSSKSINESERTINPLQRCRKSTSDLTDMTDDIANTTMTSLSRPSSPRRKGSVKGLAYLASRRGSRDSVASNMSNVSNEDIGPLNFQNTARGRQRRTSNFLELPGKYFDGLAI
ncbi:hypothetical protein NQ314_008639 [Rhamnusium bicolor]|uniref:Uncharacterized protein n=1 Tax=Rhamnusium bicolor TaxID=1586634 RepID=A0AAV8Y9X0_9CUCU|nr:hypothetical protein NQ314_008639 [Rhamnusium bicolor]